MDNIENKIKKFVLMLKNISAPLRYNGINIKIVPNFDTNSVAFMVMGVLTTTNFSALATKIEKFANNNDLLISIYTKSNSYIFILKEL